MRKILTIILTTHLLFGIASAKEYPSVGIMGVGFDTPKNINKMLKGEIRYGHYYAPNDYFSVLCPDLEIYRNIVKDVAHEGSFQVLFVDSFDQATQIEVHDLHREGLGYTKEKIDSLSNRDDFIEFSSKSFKLPFNEAKSKFEINKIEKKYFRHKKLGHMYWATIQFKDGAKSGFLYMIDSDHWVSIQVSLPIGMKKNLLKEALNLLEEFRLQGHPLGENHVAEISNSVE